MTVDAFVTNDVNYGNLYREVLGNTVTMSTSSFQYGDVVKFKWNPCPQPVSYRPEQMSFNGWFVFSADDVYHRTRLPAECYSGTLYTAEMSLNMMYTSSVIIVAELT